MGGALHVYTATWADILGELSVSTVLLCTLIAETLDLFSIIRKRSPMAILVKQPQKGKCKNVLKNKYEIQKVSSSNPSYNINSDLHGQYQYYLNMSYDIDEMRNFELSLELDRQTTLDRQCGPHLSVYHTNTQKIDFIRRHVRTLNKHERTS